MVELLAGVRQIDFVDNAPAKSIGTVGTGFEAFLLVDEGINTDYVLESRFVSNMEQPKLLYRSIMLKKKEIEDRVGVWADAKKVALVVFSDEQVYSNDDEPIDPDHFALQEDLVKPDSVLTSRFLSISAIRFADDVEKPMNDQAESVMKVLSKNYKGIYMEQFAWEDLKENIMGMILASGRGD